MESPAEIRIFLSCVADEFVRTDPNNRLAFESYRDYLARELRDTRVRVLVKEDLVPTTGDRLQTLDEAVSNSQLVVHLIGDMTGECAGTEEVARLRQRHAELFADQRALAVRLEDPAPISYTQWECYLAIEHQSQLLILVPEPESLRSPFHQQMEDQVFSQAGHRRLIALLGKPWDTFLGHDSLCRKVLGALLRHGLVPMATEVPARRDGRSPTAALTAVLGLIGVKGPGVRTPLPQDPGAVAKAVAENLKTGGGESGTERFLRALRAVGTDRRLTLQKLQHLLDQQVAKTQAALQGKPSVAALCDLALAQLAAGEFEDAMQTCVEAAELAEQEMKSYPDNAAGHRQAALNAYLLCADAARAAHQSVAAQEAVLRGCRLISLAREPQLWADYYSTLADLLLAFGKAQEAEPYIRTIMALQEQNAGPASPQMATALALRARWFYTRRKWLELEAVAERIIAIQNSQPEAERPLLPSALNHLGSALLNQGLREKAGPILRQALAECESRRGPDHPDTLTSVNNLAGWLYSHGEMSEAEPLLRRALAGFERVLGPDHPDTLNSVNNLVYLLNAKGDLKGAEPLLRRALAGQERVLGLEHPDTLTTLNNLAFLLRTKGDLAGAEPLYRRALAGCERVLGKDHPDTLGSLHNLAGLLDAKSDFAGAEVLLRRALAGRERALGPDHPNTLGTLNNLARLLQDKGDLAEAETLALRAVEGARATLGAQHAETKLFEENLADIRRALAVPPEKEVGGKGKVISN